MTYYGTFAVGAKTCVHTIRSRAHSHKMQNHLDTHRTKVHIEKLLQLDNMCMTARILVILYDQRPMQLLLAERGLRAKSILDLFQAVRSSMSIFIIQFTMCKLFLFSFLTSPIFRPALIHRFLAPSLNFPRNVVSILHSWIISNVSKD